MKRRKIYIQEMIKFKDKITKSNNNLNNVEKNKKSY